MAISCTLYIAAFINMEESLFPPTFLLDFLTDIGNLMSLVFVLNYDFLLIFLLLFTFCLYYCGLKDKICDM